MTWTRQNSQTKRGLTLFANSRGETIELDRATCPGTYAVWFFSAARDITGVRVFVGRVNAELYGERWEPRKFRCPELCRLVRGIAADPTAPVEPLIDYLRDVYPEAATFYDHLTSEGQ